MSLLERFKNLTTGTTRRTLISSITIALLIPTTLLASSQRWELRKEAAEPTDFTATTDNRPPQVDAATLDATGDKKIAVIMFNFSNDRSRPYTKEEVYLSIFESDEAGNYYYSLNFYYQEVSFGQLSFPGSTEDIFGWYELESDNRGCNIFGWVGEADAKVREDGIDLSNYDYRIYISPYASGCVSTGITSAYVYLNGTINIGTAVHEAGHMLGLKHASSLFCGEAAIDDYSNCNLAEYGDKFDIMGRGLHHLNSAHKIFLGWIPDSRVVTVMQSGTYTISYLEGYTSGPQVLKIKKPNTNEYYYLEYRQPVPFFDWALPETITRGVSIRIWKGDFINAVPNTKLLDLTPETANDFTDAALSDGSIFVDQINSITVTQLSHNSESVTVQVSIPPLEPPRCPVPPPASIPNAGSALYFNCLRWGEGDYVIITDGDGRLPLGEEMTIEVWVRPEIDVDISTIFGKYVGSLESSIYSLGISYSKPRFYIKTTQSFVILQSDDDIVDDGSTWTHLAFSKKNNEVKLFVNGVLKKSYSLTEAVADRTDAIFSLGAGLWKGPIRTSFFGAIDDLRISNTARNIEEDWNNGVYFEPLAVDENTLALWRFEEDLEDSSGNGNNGVGHGTISYIDGRVPVICVPESMLPGDLDCDCDVDIVDIMMVCVVWNTCEGDADFKPEYDFDGDGRISIADIMYVAAKWHTYCPE